MSEAAIEPVQPRRVLVVDDSEVEVANNLIAFWAHMAEEAPDLILMDVMMQEITGFELALQLKRNHEYKAIPIIFVTSLDQAGYI